MYKNKVFRPSSPGSALAGLSLSPPSPLTLLPTCLLQRLPSFRCNVTEETVEQKSPPHQALCFYFQFTKLPSKPADCISLRPNAQHPAPSNGWLDRLAGRSPPVNFSR